MKRRLMRALVLLVLLAFMAMALLAVLFHAAPGEWRRTFAIGPWTYSVSVVRLLRVATHSQVITWLDGWRVRSEFGVIDLHKGRDGELLMHCQPCHLQSAAIGRQMLHLERVRVSLRRRDDLLQGDVQFDGGVHAHWQGRLQPRGIVLHITLPQTSIHSLYALLGNVIPEMSHVHIRGTVTAQMQIAWPQRHVRIQPVVDNFQVSGLGTDVLRRRLPTVQCRQESLPLLDATMLGSSLPRAVVAAEDQRFHEHQGYDLRELVASLNRNQEHSRIARGGSTLNQQLARLLFVGSERSHVRKLRELLYAVEMEGSLGKARMLQIYLNVAPWGQGICGAEVAAQRYFGRHAVQLSRAESAWLAAMLHQPDRELLQWQRRGRPDPARISRVINNMGLGPKTRARALAQIATMTPPANVSVGTVSSR